MNYGLEQDRKMVWDVVNGVAAATDNATDEPPKRREPEPWRRFRGTDIDVWLLPNWLASGV